MGKPKRKDVPQSASLWPPKRPLPKAGPAGRGSRGQAAGPGSSKPALEEGARKVGGVWGGEGCARVNFLLLIMVL